jgi:hypothetical protein
MSKMEGSFTGTEMLPEIANRRGGLPQNPFVIAGVLNSGELID